MNMQSKLQGASCPACAEPAFEYTRMVDSFTRWQCTHCEAGGRVEGQDDDAIESVSRWTTIPPLAEPAVMSPETARQIGEQMVSDLWRARQRSGASLGDRKITPPSFECVQVFRVVEMTDATGTVVFPSDPESPNNTPPGLMRIAALPSGTRMRGSH